VRFGWRRYGGDGTGTKVVSHYSLGLVAGFGHSVVVGRVQRQSQVNGWTTGAFGDVGGTYLLTPKFGIGALATAGLTYTNSVGKSSSGARYREWSIGGDRKSTRLNSSHDQISYAVFCLKKKKKKRETTTQQNNNSES